MILILKTCIFINLLFLYKCFDIIKIKSHIPYFMKDIDNTNAVQDDNIIQLFHKIRPYTYNKNKIVIKRIVPHGTVVKTLKNKKYQTFYIPLIRIHKSRPIENDIEDKTNNKLDSNENNDILDQKLEDFVGKEIYNKKVLLEPIRTKANNKINLILLKNKHKPIKSVNSQNNRLKSYDNKFIYLLKVLRSPQFDKSGETNDHFSQNLVNEFDEVNKDIDGEGQWMPHYPLWNYWTYKKQIHQDVCPEKQVKIGNKCLWTPPH